MDTNSIVAIIAAISGGILGWLGRSRTVKQDTRTEASRDAILQTDVEYIKRGIDDVRLEQKAQGQRFDILSERVTRLEESTKQAHHRLNRLDGNTRSGE